MKKIGKEYLILLVKHLTAETQEGEQIGKMFTHIEKKDVSKEMPEKTSVNISNNRLFDEYSIEKKLLDLETKF